MHPLLDVLADPGASAVLSDFDGTLSDTVVDPSAAAPRAGVVELFSALAAKLDRVAVVSGRPVDFLERHFVDPAVQLSGLYGLEARIDGERVEAEGAARWRPVVAEVVDLAAAELGAGVTVEGKGLSLTIHHRAAPERADEVGAVARRLAATSGLELRSAKASVELHPPIPADKGTALETLVVDRPLRRVIYLGDDVGDLPAFDALDRLKDLGVGTLRIVVGSPELDPSVRSRADVLAESPEAAVELLTLLTE